MSQLKRQNKNRIPNTWLLGKILTQWSIKQHFCLIQNFSSDGQLQQFLNFDPFRIQTSESDSESNLNLKINRKFGEFEKVKKKYEEILQSYCYI